MKLPLLLTSTFTDDTRASTVTKKTCLLCGWTYYYRPIHCREHLGLTSVVGANHVQLCKPFPEHIQRHAQIVKELKQRDEHDKIQDRETVKRSLQSGEPNNVVDVELFSNSEFTVQLHVQCGILSEACQAQTWTPIMCA